MRNEILSLEVFGKIIYGDDVTDFMAKSKEEKRKWILANTGQKNEALIHDFVCDCKEKKGDPCLDCGKSKPNAKRNISNGVQPSIDESKAVDTAESNGNDIAGQKPAVKRGKA